MCLLVLKFDNWDFFIVVLNVCVWVDICFCYEVKFYSILNFIGEFYYREVFFCKFVVIFNEIIFIGLIINLVMW